MSFFYRQSPRYRTDIWVGRYLAHPLSAWVHPLLALALIVLLMRSPTVALNGWVFGAIAVVPGVWLFIATMIWGAGLMAKFTGSQLFDAHPLTWRQLIVCRELIAAIALSGLWWAGISWSQAQPFDDADFSACVSRLNDGGKTALAALAQDDMTTREFNAACAKALAANHPRPPAPANLEELKRQYGTGL